MFPFCNSDAILAAKSTAFSLLNFKVVFTVIFTRVCLTTLQAVLSFDDLQSRSPSNGRRLEAAVFVFATVKFVLSYWVRAGCGPYRRLEDRTAESGIFHLTRWQCQAVALSSFPLSNIGLLHYIARQGENSTTYYDDTKPLCPENLASSHHRDSIAS